MIGQRSDCWQRRSIGTLIVALLLTTTVSASLSEDDQARAATLAAQAEQAEASGNRPEAARLWLRAVRWNPTRLADHRRAIDLLESFNPRAAIRNAAALLRVDPGFAQSHPKLLERLRKQAIDLGTEASVADAALFSERLARETTDRPGFPLWRRATLWLEAGEQHALVGQIDAASKAFDRLQQLAIANPQEVVQEPIDWATVANVHLNAGESDRGLVAIGILTEQQGPTATVATLRARAALAVDEPLVAIEHVEEALLLAEPTDAWELEEPSPYDTLIAALQEINQPERIVPTLRRFRRKRPNDRVLTLALIDQLAAAEEIEEAWQLANELVQQLLSMTDEPMNRLTRDRQVQLASSAERMIELAQSRSEVEKLLHDLPAVIDRLGTWEWLNGALARLAEESDRRAAMASWLALKIDQGLMKTDSDGLSPGTRRAAMLVASRLQQDDRAVALFKLRINTLLTKRADLRDADLRDIEAEFYSGIDSMVAPSDKGRSADLLRWLIERIEASEVRDDASARLAILRIDLAKVLANSLPEAPAKCAEAIADVDRLMTEADQGDQETDIRADVLAGQAEALLACGRTSEALQAADAVARLRVTGGLDDRFGAGRFRRAILRSANAVSPGDSSADVNRATELYELLLDADPDDSEALNSLAYLWADRHQSLDRAERMARRAVSQHPESPACLDTLGWVLYQQGELSEAATTLAEAIRLAEVGAPFGDLATIRQHHAAVLSALGRAEEAEATGRSDDGSKNQRD